MDNAGKKENAGKYDNEALIILQKIQDMRKYAYPIIMRWSIAQKYAVGNDIMHCMNEILELAVAVRWKLHKKTALTDLDVKNKTLQAYVKDAFDLEILKGLKSYKEWNRRSEEIGKMIGGYKNSIYEAEMAEMKKTAEQKQQQRGNPTYYHRGR